MRILITTQFNYQDGGMQTYLWAIAKQLSAAGHEIQWLIGQCTTEAWLFPDTDKTNYWEIKDTPPEEIKKSIRQWRPDIVYSHGLYDLKWDEWLVSQFPVVSFLHGHNGACISGTKCHSLAGKITPCSRRLSPACLLLYLPLGCGGSNPITMLSHYRKQRETHRLLCKLSKILVGSQYMLELQARQGIPKSKLRKIPMFPTAVKPLEQLNPIDTWHNRILMMSRLTSFKGTGLAVEAVAIAAKQLGRKLTLRMAGDGPLKHQIRRDAERFNVPTEFLGQLLPQEIHRAIVDVDALLFPSLGPESFGLAGIEAGCFGVPAVGFPVGGISEWLVDGKTGVMANAEFLDANSLGQALAKCLENWEKFQYLRTNALETAKKFSTEAHLAQLIEIFTEVIDEFKTKRD